MQDDFGIAARLEDRSAVYQLLSQLTRVDEVAVVRHGDLSVRAVDEKRLSVLQLALAGRRVTGVPDRQVARQFLERRLAERLGHLPHRARGAHAFAVSRDDPGALLASMLERVKAEVREVCRFGMSEDPEDAALVLELVEHVVVCRTPG